MTQPRPPLILILVTLVYLVLGCLVVLLALVVGSGTITWDIKGYLLTGGRLLLFSSALGLVGSIALCAAYGLWRGRAWSRRLALAFWLGAGALGLITDRSVEGPGEPLRVYLVDMMLLPAALTAAVVYLTPGIRRYFARVRDQGGIVSASEVRG